MRRDASRPVEVELNGTDDSIERQREREGVHPMPINDNTLKCLSMGGAWFVLLASSN